MSKINAIRFVNINYNNNMNKISDEAIYVNGDNTLLTMDNGVGKTVMVQLLTALFVQKRYRNVKERPFANYFTSSKPSFIMVEWVLDGGAGYVLTGMMVRQNQHLEEGNNDVLDMLNFVAEYRSPCPYDIHHLNILEKNQREMTLKSFQTCRQLFESLKRDNKAGFAYYDMNNSAQSRQYFQKLLEFGIDYREWQSIIREVNKDESGLSNLFEECRNERELIEKWFLTVIEEKLNQSQDKIQEFRELTSKYIKSYHDNYLQIQRKDNISYLEQRAEEIKLEAEKMAAAEGEAERQLQRLAGLYNEMEKLRQQTQAGLAENQLQLEQLQADILQVTREEISASYYQHYDAYAEQQQQGDKLKHSLVELEQNRQQWQTRQQLLACACQQQQLDEAYQQIIQLEAQRNAAQQKDADQKPERDYLGYVLKQHYAELMEKQSVAIAEREQRIAELADNITRLQQIEEGCQQELNRLHKQQGRLQAQKDSFDDKEASYAQQYGAELHRNLMGIYEDGLLDILALELSKQQQANVNFLTVASKELVALEEQIKNNYRQLQDYQRLQVKKEGQQQKLQEQLAGLQQQVADRHTLLQHLDLDSKELFNDKLIAKQLAQKLAGVAETIKRTTMEEAALKKELSMLETGRNLELSEEFVELLAHQDINLVHGMEWLKRQQNSETANKELLQRFPFLPYALIMGQAELQRLQAVQAQVFTTSPIPIILREMLSGEADSVQVRNGQGVHFYMHFNEELLDEAKLAQLKEAKLAGLQRKIEELGRWQESYRNYLALNKQFQQQAISKEILAKVEKQLEVLAEEKTELEHQCGEVSQQLSQNQQRKKQLEGDMLKGDKQKAALERQGLDLESLVRAYGAYGEILAELQVCNQTMADKQQKLEQAREKAASCQQERLHNQEKLLLERNSQNQLSQDAAIYQNYHQVEKPDALDVACDDIQQVKARYLAIVEAYTGEIKLLEAQMSAAQKRADGIDGRLQSLSRRYKLSADAWRDVVYSKLDEEQADDCLQEAVQAMEVCQKKIYAADKAAALAQQRMESTLDSLQRECQTREPLQRSGIQVRDYGADKKVLLYQQKQCIDVQKAQQERLAIYEGALDALADFKPAGDIAALFEEEFSSMSREELRRIYGQLKIGYARQGELIQRYQNRMKDSIQRVMQDEKLAEDFFQKQLQTLLGVTEHGQPVLEQLALIMEVYHNIMQKLLLDLARVDQERDNLVGMLLEYISNVHEQMGKLDRNSAINIRGRSIKMLRLELPVWEQNDGDYLNMMQELIGELTDRGVELLEAAADLNDVIGQEITTRNLYDTVIGINNIGIQLYKIEQERETQITWHEVAKNSGGEGFLSAFVILSSLLYFMRRDDGDVFADRNEGKVLLMDNPFAKTYSPHLLKPLMDVAKKNNTQLICLTGLGGDAIYDRFDNIYMLRLINTSLSKVRYLSSRHISGSEPKELTADHLQVAEEMQEITLF